MKAQWFQRWLPGKRRWWLFSTLMATLVGLAAASLFWPPARHLAAAVLGLADTCPDGHAAPARGRAAACNDSSCTAAHDQEHASPPAEAHEDHDGHDKAECDHDHAQGDDPHNESEDADHRHDEAEAVKLSTTAEANVGLRLAKVELGVFERTITVPGTIVERPGRTNIQVAAPLTGVITRVWPMQGEAVSPGQPLFDLRLTHEEVVESQADFLRTAEELDVIQREVTRLEKVAAEGAIPGKTLLERKYEQQKWQAVLRSQRQRLLLHGLSTEQIDGILAKHALVSTLTIFVPGQNDPPAGEAAAKDAAARVLQVQELNVEKGQHVKAGDSLCALADHSELFIQGRAFEQDAPALDKLANNDWRVSAVLEAKGRSLEKVQSLRLLYVANKVETESRAVLFYVQLPNKLVRDHQTADGHRFAAWQFKPGQRVELLVPVERWADKIVLPVSAIVQDGPESYVFERNDGHFDRRSVHVEYRDQHSVVIANDGALTPGKTVIVSGSYQVHLAMKNKAGGAPDPHAGHNH